ncbi:DUF4358 domain-containing protein [Candidatus Soleaferrea massiliensis]|uniref:DUF4358 domain-containing protein n=1 Tax=Candidatus Soleaferrea massiliensis TaxID=1470354 RepID=UPI0005900118|nr:DUF4358 domain-containing protein [Candidatus Soleaferrea massiliensis]
MKKQIAVIFAALSLFLLLLTGCGSSAEAETVDAKQQKSMDIQVPITNLDDIINEVYKGVDIKDYVEITDENMKEILKINPDSLESYAIKRASGKYGLADVYILKPKADKEQEVRKALESILKARQDEFEHYDVYNALAIAQNGKVYDREGYQILLMIDDQQQVERSVNKYLKQLK